MNHVMTLYTHLPRLDYHIVSLSVAIYSLFAPEDRSVPHLGLDLGKRSAILLTFVKLAAAICDDGAISTGGSIESPVGMRLGPLSVIQRLLKSGC